MGQAKRRGTFEERRAHALKRNSELRAAINDKPQYTAYVARHGMQRFASRLIAAGLISPKLPPVARASITTRNL
jgi:hypothetical protein